MGYLNSFIKFWRDRVGANNHSPVGVIASGSVAISFYVGAIHESPEMVRCRDAWRASNKISGEVQTRMFRGHTPIPCGASGACPHSNRAGARPPLALQLDIG